MQGWGLFFKELEITKHANKIKQSQQQSVCISCAMSVSFPEVGNDKSVSTSASVWAGSGRGQSGFP